MGTYLTQIQQSIADYKAKVRANGIAHGPTAKIGASLRECLQEYDAYCNPDYSRIKNLLPALIEWERRASVTGWMK